MRHGQRVAATTNAATTTRYGRGEGPTGGAPAATTTSLRGANRGSGASARPLAPANTMDGAAVLVCVEQ